MAGSDVVFNIARGKIGYYAGLPAANDAIIAVPIEASGLEADATIVDHDTLSAVLAGSSNEQTTLGRKTLSSVTLTVDDTNNRADVDSDDPADWTASAGNATGALIICYDPDTTGGDDTTVVPLVKLSMDFTPDGSTLDAQFASAGWWRSS